jgi:ABC-type antimicrobial peptide transport system permease subunit
MTIVVTVIARSVRLAAIGAVVGLSIALAGASVMRSLLFAVDPRDPATFVATTVALVAIAILACAGPAIRAARVDPMATLRAE